MEQNDILDQPNESEKMKKRPVAITVICILGFIGAAISIPLIFSNITQQIGSWYPPYLGLSSAVGLLCMFGLWNMKKWAAYTYTALVGLNQIVLIAMGLWSVGALIIPGVVIGIALSNLDKMD